MKKLTKPLVALKEWDKRMIRKFQQKFGLTDYQVLCITFAKGFVIGAILL